MRVQLLGLILLLGAMTVSSSGCLVLAVGAGAGTVAYMRGDIEAEEPYEIDQVYTAAKKAAQDLKLHVIAGEGGRDALSANIVTRDAADKRITIKLKATTVQTTKVSIRVGTFGNEAKSRLIYNKIRDNLKAASPPSVPAQTPTPVPTAESAQAPPASPATEPAQAPPDSPASQAVAQTSEPSETPTAQDVSAPPPPPPQ